MGEKIKRYGWREGENIFEGERGKTRGWCELFNYV